MEATVQVFQANKDEFLDALENSPGPSEDQVKEWTRATRANETPEERAIREQHERRAEALEQELTARGYDVEQLFDEYLRHATEVRSRGQEQPSFADWAEPEAKRRGWM